MTLKKTVRTTKRMRGLSSKKKKQLQWFDIRRHDFARVAMIIPIVCLGDPATNVKALMEMLREAHEAGAQFSACPELCLTGYSMEDGFFHEVLLDDAETGLGEILEQTKDWDMLIAVGAPIRWQNYLLNCAIGVYKGKILGIIPKGNLAEGGIHYEARQFDEADVVPQGSTIDFCGQTDIPIGTDILFQHHSNGHFIIGFDICEDGWTPGIGATTKAALEGAFVLANISASPAALHKPEYRQMLARMTSGTCCATRMYVSCVGESTADVTWDGHGIVACNGKILCESVRHSRKAQCIVCDIDLGSLANERRRWHGFKKCASQHRKEHSVPYRTVKFGESFSAETAGKYCHFLQDISPLPFVPSVPRVLDETCAEVSQILRSGLYYRLKLLGYDRSDKKPVIMLSGGRDSANALWVTALVMDELGRSRKDIICVTSPGFGTTPGTLKDAIDYAKALGVTIKEVPIVRQNKDDPFGIAEILLNLIGHDRKTEDITYENAQAWCRAIIGFATGSINGGLLIGTGDLSEILVGWCTMFADHAAHYGINSGIAKTLMESLLMYAADVLFVEEKGVGEIIRRICGKVPSPELKGGNKGKITQSTDSEIGPPDLRDFYGWYFLRHGTRPSTIARLAYQAFAEKYDLATIKKWLGVFLRRVFANKFKSNCLPDGPIVASVGISPRGYWRFPSDGYANAWQRNLDLVPECVCP